MYESYTLRLGKYTLNSITEFDYTTQSWRRRDIWTDDDEIYRWTIQPEPYTPEVIYGIFHDYSQNNIPLISMSPQQISNIFNMQFRKIEPKSCKNYTQTKKCRQMNNQCTKRYKREKRKNN